MTFTFFPLGTRSIVSLYFLMSSAFSCSASISALLLGMRQSNTQHRITTESENTNYKREVGRFCAYRTDPVEISPQLTYNCESQTNNANDHPYSQTQNLLFQQASICIGFHRRILQPSQMYKNVFITYP